MTYFVPMRLEMDKLDNEVNSVLSSTHIAVERTSERDEGLYL